MKALYLALLLTLFVCCTSNAQQTWVMDTEHDLTVAQISTLDSLFKSHEKKTTNEIALVTTPNYGTEKSMLLFSVKFGRQYGVGKAKTDNGIVIAFSNSKREVRISTGLGLERILNDEIAKKVIDRFMTPYFKRGQIFDGLWEGSKAIVDFLEKPENKLN